MSNNLVTRIDLVHVNKDGTIDIIDTPSWHEYPFTFRYKLYLTFEENINNIFHQLFETPPNNYEFSPRFKAYIDDRSALFDEIRTKYASVIEDIENANFSSDNPNEKKKAYKDLDSLLNHLYPYPYIKCIISQSESTKSQSISL